MGTQRVQVTCPKSNGQTVAEPGLSWGLQTPVQCCASWCHISHEQGTPWALVPVGCREGPLTSFSWGRMLRGELPDEVGGTGAGLWQTGEF